MPSEPLATPARRHYALVVVSPHLDDAVFSCSASIAAARASGPVLVVNVFSRFLGDAGHHGMVVGGQRQAEERAAAQVLGFESLGLDELDASCRRPEYRAIGNLFRPPVAADLAWLPTLRQRLHDLLATITWDRLLVPLAVGWHVDHLLVHQAFASWRGRPDLAWYEDVPYAWIDQATRLRLDELGRHPGDDGAAGLAACGLHRAAWRLIRDYARTALMRNLRPAALRLAAQPAVAWYLYRLVAHHRRPGSSPASRLQWTPRAPAGAEALAKVRAMAIYGSQFQTFFLDQADCRARLTTYAAGFSDAALERQWICRTGDSGHPARTPADGEEVGERPGLVRLAATDAILAGTACRPGQRGRP